ncbi:hypothetical protein [Moellerella wisconsensis]|uniref:hypothetical protein n=1 Tax=Moellerella wisconsensis TaxID=158849 RepID=UPI000640F617|nr:hypothetical protein [Moellerella wisconsensis]KLN95683.1 hypothetical protein VK86_14335 [Moellerella wisconsensis]UNH29275.1 hypothetical protein MNY64_17665 [Moellerella wisconsensis]
MNQDYNIIKSRLSWLKFHDVKLEITTKTGKVVTGFVRKFDEQSALIDEVGFKNKNDFLTVNYSSIESFRNIESVTC